MRKKRIRDIFTPKIIGIAPTASIAEAMGVMRSHDISCVVVLDAKKPVGILTERNLVTFAAGRGQHDENYPVSRLMSSPVLVVPQEMDIYDAYNLLFTRHVRHLVVVDDNQEAIGVVTQSNIVEHLSYDSFIDMKQVSQVMSKIVYTLPREVSVQRALHDMSEKALSCLVVVEQGRPVGILTERDVARLLLEVSDLASLRLEEVMSASVKTVYGDTSLLKAVELMKELGLRRLVVVDGQGRIAGLATQTDVVKGLEGKYIERLNQIIAEKESVIRTTTRDLAEKSIYLDNILSSAIDYGIVAVDLTGRIVYFNPGAENLLGLCAGETVGVNVREIRLAEGGNPFQLEEAGALADGQGRAYTLERRLRAAKQYLHIRLNRITDQDRSLIGYLFMLTDITERKLAEDELRLAHQVLEQKVQARTFELEKVIEGTIQAMALTVEMRDPYTSGHQRRVADLAAGIARHLGLPAAMVEGIYMAGLIHDIGKIRVPSSILCHPGSLSPAQFAIIKAHPQTGYDILKGIEFPWPVAEIVLQHHEKMDGSGYPAALKGEEISLKARIMAVADVVEAMSSHRPYRPALGIKAALDEILRGRGSRYDPDVVDACRLLFTQGDYALPVYVAR